LAPSGAVSAITAVSFVEGFTETGVMFVSGGISTVCSIPNEQADKTKISKTTDKDKIFKFFKGTLSSFMIISVIRWF
jgi:hypothetical protein